jgi:dTDP-4-amino-4,6-dideoxygalactose transaminase
MQVRDCAIANGTVALELALYCLGIGPGDEVVVPSRTFIASASCAVMRGATPVVADIDRESSNLTAETIKRVITSRTKAIIAVHLAGWPCDMESILELARSHRIAVIEDCAQAHGARYCGRPIGSFGDMAAFSFCQDKNMTTGGEGGMLLTNDRRLWELGWSFKDHGKSFEAVYERSHPRDTAFSTNPLVRIGDSLRPKRRLDACCCGSCHGRKASAQRRIFERGICQDSGLARG